MRHVITLQPETSIEDVIKSLDEGGVGFLALVDKEGLLVGIVTDGDIRRAILRKELSIESVVNVKPISMPSSSTKEAIIAKLKSVHRRHMPLVDEQNRLCAVFSLDDVEFISKENFVVVMAGGLGSRLGELTKNTPKPMLVVGDRPMLQHLVEQFRDQGFYKFVFCLNYMKDSVIDFFGDGDRFGVKISYVTEDKRLGTAGALALLDQDLFKSPFFVVNGDVLTSLDFSEVIDWHVKSESCATMCVRWMRQEVPYGVVKSHEDGAIVEIKEKPSYEFKVNAGIYVLNPETLEFVPKNTFFDMPQLFERLMEGSVKCTAFNLEGYWVDVGKKEDLFRASNDILSYEKQ